MNRFCWSWAILIGLVSGGDTFADTFGNGTNSFSIDFVSIGNPGNPPDANPNPAGAVAYPYRIGKYEISEQMIDKANVLGGLGITKDTRGADYPATSITWYEACAVRKLARHEHWERADVQVRFERELSTLDAQRFGIQLEEFVPQQSRTLLSA